MVVGASSCKRIEWIRHIGTGSNEYVVDDDYLGSYEIIKLK